MSISPKFLMNLIQNIEDCLWRQYNSYKNVENYIKKWQEPAQFDINGYPYADNFVISYKDSSSIDLNKTLHEIKDEDLILKIGADLGLEIPGFIPSIPVLKRKLEVDFVKAKNQLEQTVKDVYENPDQSVHLANTTLETIVKHVLDDMNTDYNSNDTLKKLIEKILQEFKLRDENLPNEFRDLCGGLVRSAQSIESLRSDKSVGHGSARDDYIIDSPIYASFVVNSVASIGLFLIEYYENKYKKEYTNQIQGLTGSDQISVPMPF